MTDQEISVKVTADTSEFKAGMKEVEGSLDSTASATESAGGSWNNFATMLGAVSPKIRKVQTAYGKITKTMGETAGGAGGMAGALSAVAGPAMLAVMAVNAVKDTAKKAWEGIKKTASMYDTQEAEQALGTIKSSLKKVQTSLGGLTLPILKGISAIVEKICSGLVQVVKYITYAIYFLKSLFFGVSEEVEDAGETAEEIVDETSAGLASFDQLNTLDIENEGDAETAEEIKQAIADAEGAIVNLKEKWHQLCDDLGEKWGTFVSDLKQKWSDFVAKFQEFVAKIKEKWDAFVAKLQEAWDKAVAFLVDVWNGIVETFTAIWDTVCSVLTSIWEGFVAGSTEAWNIIMEAVGLLEGIFDGICNVMRIAWETLVGILTGIWDALLSLFTGDWQGFVDAISGIWTTLTEGLKKAWNAIYEPIKTAIEWIWGKIEDVIDAVSGVLGFFGDIGGSIFGGVKSIFGLAEGGVIPPNNPSLYILGDNTTEEEVVSPVSTIESAVISALNRVGATSATGGAQTVDVTLNIDSKKLARYSFDSFRSESRRRGLSI